MDFKKSYVAVLIAGIVGGGQVMPLRSYNGT